MCLCVFVCLNLCVRRLCLCVCICSCVCLCVIVFVCVFLYVFVCVFEFSLCVFFISPLVPVLMTVCELVSFTLFGCLCLCLCLCLFFLNLCVFPNGCFFQSLRAYVFDCVYVYESLSDFMLLFVCVYVS